jgi:hypothetical protein
MRKTGLIVLVILFVGILYWNYRSVEGFEVSSDAENESTQQASTPIQQMSQQTDNQQADNLQTLMRTALVSGKVNVSYDPALGFKERVMKRMEDIRTARMGTVDYEYSVPPELDDVYEEEMKALSKLL